MRKKNPKSANIDSFKYSILISSHYYDISYHREKTSKLDYTNNYNFTNTHPTDFERNNPNISLTILDENNKLIYRSNNDGFKKAYIVKINEHRYAAIKPTSDNLIKRKQLIKKMSHTELEQILIHLIKYFDNIQLKKVLIDIIKNNVLLESEYLLTIYL